MQFSSQWDTNEISQSIEETLTRPRGEGYQQDMQFSLDYERNKMLKEQNDIQWLRFWFGR